MHAEACKMDTRRYRELLDIQAVSTHHENYYKEMRNRYNAMIAPEKIKLPEQPANMALDASSEEAREVMFSIFGSLKRGMGYGG